MDAYIHITNSQLHGNAHRNYVKLPSYKKDKLKIQDGKLFFLPMIAPQIQVTMIALQIHLVIISYVL